MIGKLRGIIDSIGTDELVLDVGGVGYVLFCSSNTLRQLPTTGHNTSLVVETHVREDHIHLYGFAQESERDAFRTLTKVSGIGSKLALAILSVMNASQLATAIAAQDKAAFQAISGIGPKMAARLLTELKDRFSVSFDASPIASLTPSHKTEKTVLNDALSALTHLGYNRTEAFTALNRVLAQTPELTLELAIKAGLKELAA